MTFSVAAALEVEDAVVVPAVLVIANEQTLRVGGQGGLAGAGQTEEDGQLFLPSLSVLAEQCMEAMPFSGRK